MQQERSCIVIGAGFAGLYAARKLKEHLPDVLLVEAQPDIGGRVRQLHGLAPWPVEAGPEFVHGAEPKNKLLRVVGELGGLNIQFEEKPWPDWYYFGAERRLVRGDDAGADIDQLHDFFDAIGDERPPPAGSDVSCREWLAAKGASARQLALAEACYANDFGTSLRRLGVREMIMENQSWDDGESYLIMDKPMRTVIDALADGLDIQTGWPVTAIHYSPNGAVLRGPGGAELRARKVVVTCSLAVLQSGRIAFSPPLPAPKRDALSRLRMGNAVKVVCAFERRFWPAEFFDACCTDAFAPEVWCTRHAPSDPSCARLHTLIGFIAGERAEALANEPHDQIVARFLEQLDAMFGGPGNATPASAPGALARAEVVDWSKAEWVRGAYSCPSYGAQPGDRHALAAPVAGSMFFAGEATHTAVNPCIQAALETGERAASEVLAALAAAGVRSRL